MAELKGTAWTCASINAAVCAGFPPRLYVATTKGEPPPRCRTRARSARQRDYLASRALTVAVRSAVHVEEVIDHPLLTLLRQPQPGA